MIKIIEYGLGGCDSSKPNNNIVEQYEVPKPPLTPDGALATLLAVTGTLTVEDAANAVGLTPDDLTHEAQAWAAATTETP